MYKIKLLTTWTPENLEELFICYRENVPNKIMMQLFGRSRDSINKTLERTGIKEIFDRKPGNRPKHEKCNYLNAQQVRTYILDTPRDPLPIQWYPSGRTRKPKTEKKTADLKLPKPKNAKQNYGDGRIAVNQMINKLQEEGYAIQTNPNTVYASKGLAYLINGEPATVYRLLMTLNLHRIERGHEPFIVLGVSH